MMAMIVAVTMLGKSVLYYFKYLLDNPDAGQLALAEMGLVSGIAIPLWMLIGRRVGLRALWLISAGMGISGLLLLAAVPLDGVAAMQAFLIGMQVVSVGLNFVFWAMLPNTIEYGERAATGLHVEGTVFVFRRSCSASRSGSRRPSSAGALPLPATYRTCGRAWKRFRRCG